MESIYKFILKNVYENSNNNAKYLLEMVLARGLQFAKYRNFICPNDISGQEYSYDVNVIMDNITIAMQLCVDGVNKNGNFAEMLKYIVEVKPINRIDFYMYYYESDFFKSLIELHLIEDILKSNFGRKPDADDLRIAGNGVINYNSDLYLNYVQGISRCVRKSQYFVNLTQNAAYSKIRNLDLNMDNNKDVYVTVTLNILKVLKKYSFYYDELIAIACCNMNIPVDKLKEAKTKRDLYSVKVNPVSDFHYTNLLDLYCTVGTVIRDKGLYPYKQHIAELRQMLENNKTYQNKLNFVNESNAFDMLCKIYGDKIEQPKKENIKKETLNKSETMESKKKSESEKKVDLFKETEIPKPNKSDEETDIPIGYSGDAEILRANEPIFKDSEDEYEELKEAGNPFTKAVNKVVDKFMGV